MMQAMNEPQDTMIAIGRGIELNQQGQREAARALFESLWAQLGPDGDPLARCGLAHSMADAQEDPHEELRWDLLALEAADAVTDHDTQVAGMATPAAALYPSLHLNLADVYHRLGDPGRAREHLERGRGAARTLGDDPYGRMIRDAFDRLEERMASGAD